jgi:hypothetical protein
MIPRRTLFRRQHISRPGKHTRKVSYQRVGYYPSRNRFPETASLSGRAYGEVSIEIGRILTTFEAAR